MNVIIDRFESGFAVVETEDKHFVNLPVKLVPSGASEGSVLTITFDVNETHRRREEAAVLMGQLWND